MNSLVVLGQTTEYIDPNIIVNDQVDVLDEVENNTIYIHDDSACSGVNIVCLSNDSPKLVTLNA